MKRKLKSTLLLAVLFMAIAFGNVKAQSQPEISDSIYSNEMKELRKLKIKLPDSYKPGSTEKYEVIYLTDGEWNIEMFSFVTKFVFGEKFMPQVILVAMPNTYIDGANMRDRDLLPHKVADNKLAGGADKFIAFIKNELIPYIDKKYPTNGTKSLYGHSYGGVFSMYVFLSNPQLFDAFYCTDPSFWWDNEYLIKLAQEKLKNATEYEKTLFIAGITETYKGMGIQKMDSILKMVAPKNLYWKMVTFPNETHNSVKYKAIYDGLKFVYDGFSGNGISFHPMGGILLKDLPTIVFLNGNYADPRYTTNGSEPTANSEKAGKIIAIKGPSTFVIKSFGGNKKYGAVSKGNFELGETFPALPKLKNAKKGGLKYSYYEGKWDSLPDFSKLKPIKTGVADSTFQIGAIQNPFNFACLFEGFIQIEKDGYYVFGLDSDDGSKFYLNGKLLLNNDGIHGTGNIKSYVVPLQKGFYPVKIEFFQRGGGVGLQLIYLLPGSQQPIGIPYNLQYYKN
jgi:predicted alpha/beta superfamily hydrolase